MEFSGYVIMRDNVDTFEANSICNMMYLVTNTHLDFGFVILHVMTCFIITTLFWALKRL